MFCRISVEEFSWELLSNHSGSPAPLFVPAKVFLLSPKKRIEQPGCEAMARTHSITCSQDLPLRLEAGQGEEGHFLLYCYPKKKGGDWLLHYSPWFLRPWTQQRRGFLCAPSDLVSTQNRDKLGHTEVRYPLPKLVFTWEKYLRLPPLPEIAIRAMKNLI